MISQSLWSKNKFKPCVSHLHCRQTYLPCATCFWEKRWIWCPFTCQNLSVLFLYMYHIIFYGEKTMIYALVFLYFLNALVNPISNIYMGFEWFCGQFFSFLPLLCIGCWAQEFGEIKLGIFVKMKSSESFHGSFPDNFVVNSIINDCSYILSY